MPSPPPGDSPPSSAASESAKRFARVAAELLGVNGVRIYHDQALFKESGGGPTPWHQDQYYWPVDTDNTVTMWMPLVDVTDQMGMLTFASGSHREGYLGTLPISEESERVFQEYVDSKGFSISRQKTMNAGDATFHYGWTLHSAPSNKSDTIREVMTVIYYADGTRVGPLDHPNRKFDRDVWLRGCEPGELAAGKLNPVLYEQAAS